jgi:hypothetical protein
VIGAAIVHEKYRLVRSDRKVSWTKSNVTNAVPMSSIARMPQWTVLNPVCATAPSRRRV